MYDWIANPPRSKKDLLKLLERNLLTRSDTGYVVIRFRAMKAKCPK